MSKLTWALLARLPGFLGARESRNIVTRSGARMRGIYPSLRFRRPLKWESQLERRLIKACEASWFVRDATTQPVTWTVPEADGRGTFEYTPDVAILTVDGQLVVGECKPTEQLKDPEVMRRLVRVAAVLANSASHMLILTEEYLSEALGARLDQALRHQQWRGTSVAREDLKHQIITHHAASCLADLTRQFGVSQAMHAICSQWVSIDWHAANDDASAVSTTHMEAWDAMCCLYPR